MKAAIDLKNSVRKRIKTTLQQSKEALFLWRTKPLKRWLNWGVGGTVKKNPVFQGLLWTLTSLISIPEIGCWQFRMIATKHLVRMSSLLSDFFLPPGSKTSFFSFLNFVVYELCKVFRLNQMKTRWKKKKKKKQQVGSFLSAFAWWFTGCCFLQELWDIMENWGNCNIYTWLANCHQLWEVSGTNYILVYLAAFQHSSEGVSISCNNDSLACLNEKV